MQPAHHLYGVALLRKLCCSADFAAQNDDVDSVPGGKQCAVHGDAVHGTQHTHLAFGPEYLLHIERHCHVHVAHPFLHALEGGCKVLPGGGVAHSGYLVQWTAAFLWDMARSGVMRISKPMSSSVMNDFSL